MKADRPPVQTAVSPPPVTAETLSVVLPIHAGVAPAHLRATFDSLLVQTLLPAEVVVVDDGPITAAHEAEVSRLVLEHGGVTRVRLPHNGGPGVANQAGLAAASGDWIAKMDADDINRPRRLEVQAAALLESGSVACGTAMLEFDGDADHIIALRESPIDHDAILARARTNNPVNHPTVVYMREPALAVGGYPDWRFGEDYALFARMLVHGCHFVNVSEPLVLFRSGHEALSRRRAVLVRRNELRLQRHLRELGLISTPRLCANLALRLGYTFLPGRAARFVSHRVLARPWTGEREDDPSSGAAQPRDDG